MASTQPDLPRGRSHLPPRHLWPERVYTRPEFRSYPGVFNATEELLERQVSAGRGDHPAVLYQDEVFSYARLVDTVDRLAGALRDLGVGEGDRVLIRSLNEPPALVANFATLKLGGVVVPTSPLLDEDKLATVANDCEPVVMVVGTYLQYDALAARRRIPSLRHVIVYGSLPAVVAASGCLSYEELVAAPGPAIAPVRRAGTDVSVLLYTSGLLEPVRATAHCQDELLIIPDGYGRCGWQVTGEDVIAGAGPINFAGGYSTILSLPYRFGATAAIIPLGTSPAGMFPVIRRHRITLLAALPTRYQAMLDVPDADPADLASLRMVSGGGEPLAAETVAGWRERFGLEIYEGFGTNGMMHVFITTAVNRVIKPGSMGAALPGYETRVLAPDGTEVGPGQLGQLLVRGPVGTLFWGHPDAAGEIATRQATAVRDGWVRVGDWVTRDADGHLFFVAREEDLVVRDGEAFGPLQVERMLAEHSAVAEVGVYAELAPPTPATPAPATLRVAGADRAAEAQQPSARTSPRPWVRALVVPAAVASEAGDLVAGLLAHARSRLPSAQVPDEVTVVDSLPRSMFGTLLRRAQWPGWLADRADRVPAGRVAPGSVPGRAADDLAPARR